jgi:hypothetical protein
MEPDKKPLPRLADVEREVAAGIREWGRRRLQERLQQIADQPGGAGPSVQEPWNQPVVKSSAGSIDPDNCGPGADGDTSAHGMRPGATITGINSGTRLIMNSVQMRPQ